MKFCMCMSDNLMGDGSLKGLKWLTIVLTPAHCHPRTGLNLSHSLHHC